MPEVPEVPSVKLGSSPMYLGEALEAPGPADPSHSPLLSEGTQVGISQCREHAKPGKGCISLWNFKTSMPGPQVSIKGC